MKIAIDCRLYRESGIGRYIRNLVSNLEILDTKNEYFLLLKREDFEGCSFADNFKKVKADISWYTLEEQLKIPKILNKISPDLVHFPHFNVPILYKKKYLVTIHDLIHQHFSLKRASTKNAAAFYFKQLGYKKVFGNALKKSSKIITPSNFVKSQLIKEWRMKEEKILVTPEGVEESLVQISRNTTEVGMAKTLKKFGILDPYFFYVGNAHPHKNIPFLIKAFLKFKEENPNFSLVLTGAENYFWKQIKNEFEVEGIIYTGYVTDEELVSLYQKSEAFLMPSLEEGFGIPVLEAMALETPVISAEIGSLLEIGREACLYFNPKKEADLIAKMITIIHDKKVKNTLIREGLERALDFSWKKMAAQTLKAYREQAL
ncbi:MAG: glycosyltransferase family 1 protein [Candidatus Daviesbacteria bacterium]|nr:glycosyltransferase family 1 protein [Candidatus Daviesbacteria bacterium]